MPSAPVLRVVPLDQIRRHEEIDPLRVGRLVDRIKTDSVQVNPMVCTESANGELVLLDGATRTEAFKSLGIGHAVVQLVEPESVTLGTWHHVVRACEPDELLDRIRASGILELSDEGWAPRVRLVDETQRSVRPIGVSANAAISALVRTYVGQWRVSRVADPSSVSVSWRYPDWGAVVEFPILSVADVVSSAISGDLLPPGITRFLVNERALRLNMDLDVLMSSATLEEKQAALKALLASRARDGRVRRYEEPVIVLDD